jgi:hypothetical protein
MILKDGIKVEYDDILSSYAFDFKTAKVKKVTSRAFPQLLDKNKWQSIGWAVLDRCGFLAKEEIDPFYLVRGNVAELIVDKYLNTVYKEKGIDIQTKRFTVQEVDYDMFPKNKRFGRVVDIGIAKPLDKRAVVEVKSKNMKNYNMIAVDKNVPEEEVLQGKFLARLSQTEKLLMAYVFFTDSQEAVIKKRMAVADDGYEQALAVQLYGDVKIKMIPCEINNEEMDGLMEDAWEKLDRLVDLGAIPAEYFNSDEIRYLNTFLPEKPKSPLVSEDDLPF